MSENLIDSEFLRFCSSIVIEKMIKIKKKSFKYRYTRSPLIFSVIIWNNSKTQKCVNGKKLHRCKIKTRFSETNKMKVNVFNFELFRCQTVTTIFFFFLTAPSTRLTVSILAPKTCMILNGEQTCKILNRV